MLDTGSDDPNPQYTTSIEGGDSTKKIWVSWIYANAGTYNAKLIVDPEDKIKETDEANNEFEFTVVVEP
jgi:subtilase family serine protease